MFSQFRCGYGLLKPLSEPSLWSVSRFTNYRHLPTGGGGSGSIRVCSCSLMLGCRSFIFGLKYNTRKGFCGGFGDLFPCWRTISSPTVLIQRNVYDLELKAQILLQFNVCCGLCTDAVFYFRWFDSKEKL